MANRLNYIDIYKGVLILLVIIHHAPLVCEKFHNPYMNLYWANNYIIAFFMPAWFVATGYCSNFNKQFWPFLWNNFKGIMIPCFTLYCINHLLQCLNTQLFEDSSWMTLKNWINPGIRTFIIEGGFYWFLSALFISKIIFWFVNKIITNRYQIYLVLLVLFYFGLYCYNNHIVNNFFFFQHAMMLTLFLQIGKDLKKNETIILSQGLVILISFFALVMVLSFANVEIPTITRDIIISPLASPLFILLSLLGSLATWYAAKCIGSNKILEYMGQGSLVMYAFNYVVLTLLANVFINIFAPTSQIFSVFCFVCIILTSAIALVCLYWLLNQKYIRIILGKF